MTTYYNEFDHNAAEWLRNLGAANHITPGEVDERSIKDISGADLAGIRRAHFFAGIGGWDYALKLAGWPDDREVWTGSCPCQPYSSAGKQEGDADPRNLWPDFFRLIRERRPATVFGEQVASAIGHGWLDRVFTDLEGEGYACGAIVLGAHSVGAPHIRKRLYWVADGGCVDSSGRRDARDVGSAEGCAESETWQRERLRGAADDGRVAGGMADGADPRCDDAREYDGRPSPLPTRSEQRGPWSDYRIIPCTDGKARRTGARVFPLAHGLPRGVGQSGAWRKGLARGASRARVGMLKGSGNAIVPEIAAEFVLAHLETKDQPSRHPAAQEKGR